VDEILGYLLDDLGSLTACSLTCKRLFGATRPLIHRQLVCLDPRPNLPKRKKSLLSRCKKDPGPFERLIEADRSGILRYTRQLTLKPKDGSLRPRFNPKDLQESLPHLRSITQLHGLTLIKFLLPPFIPTFNEHFGIFTNTLRQLDLRNAYGTAWEFLYIISQFLLLEDLTIVSPVGERTANPGRQIQAITQSPPLRGKLILGQAAWRHLSEGLAAFPGGLNFRSLEFSWSKYLEPIFTACGRTATSISYLWPRGDINSELNSSIQAYIVT